MKKKIAAVLMIALLLLTAASAMAEQWTGHYTCILGGVSDFDDMGEMTVVDEGGRLRFSGDVTLIANFVVYSTGNKTASAFEVTGTLSELDDDYSNRGGIYLSGIMEKSGDYIFFTVTYSGGSEMRSGDEYIFMKD